MLHLLWPQLSVLFFFCRLVPQHKPSGWWTRPWRVWCLQKNWNCYKDLSRVGCWQALCLSVKELDGHEYLQKCATCGHHQWIIALILYRILLQYAIISVCLFVCHISITKDFSNQDCGSTVGAAALHCLNFLSQNIKLQIGPVNTFCFCFWTQVAKYCLFSK